MPSKFVLAAATSGMSAAMGCVVGIWSCVYAQILRFIAKLAHSPVYCVDVAIALAPWFSAKDSLSHRSSHHAGVARSPNHMWHISCRVVFARR